MTIARIAFAFAVLVFAPSIAFAQASIVGVVRDGSGAVLPGVTVEAASPVLIEKVRTAITDDAGQYRIENLRPGSYTVTFTLPGFATVQREGLELTGSFAATVNADLRVGGVEETITVVGESPVVDVSNTTRQQVLDADVIASIPTGRNAAVMASLLTGVSVTRPDVGGVTGESFSSVGTVSMHGVADVRTTLNGVSVHSAQGNGATGVGNIAAYQEMVVSSGVSAEFAEGGVQMNLIPREGGNTFSGYLFTAFANDAMQGTNFSDNLRNRGLGTPNTLTRYTDVNPAFGGPVKRDKLWFYFTARRNDAYNFAPVFFNKNMGNPDVWTYEPATDQDPATWKSIFWNAVGRLTWQVNPKHKVSLGTDSQHACQCPRIPPFGGPAAPEAAVGSFISDRPWFVFGDWTSPLTDRLLIEAAVVRNDERTSRPFVNPWFTQPPGAPKMISVLEQSNNFAYRATTGNVVNGWYGTLLARVAMSRISGGHSWKVGLNTGDEATAIDFYTVDSPISYRFNNGVPNRVTLVATPWRRETHATKFALFGQDRWAVSRFTLTGGLRYDYHQVSYPETVLGPATLLPNRHIVLPAGVAVRWHDISPRVGGVYDLFGTGKTAVKVSIGKYLAVQSLPNSGGLFTTDLTPSARLVSTVNRAWNDANRDFVPNCDLIAPAANGECGAMDNPAFGTISPGVNYDPDTLRGLNRREYNWQLAAGVQHEITRQVAVEFGYFRTTFGNLAVIDDRALSASDFDTFSITAPSDPRLPGGGGYVVSGLYNVKPAKFGIPTDNFVTFADKFGKQTQHWNGVDMSVNGRISRDLVLQGGISTGRTSVDYCDVAAALPEMLFGGRIVTDANPGSWLPADFCEQQSAFRTQGKFLGTYTVPRLDVQLAATIQSLPGPAIAANFVATNAIVAPSLNRPLSGAVANMTVNIVEPGTMYGERLNQVDLRLSKILRFGGTRSTISLDLYNVLNTNAVLVQSNAYGRWQQPEAILNPRFAKVIYQINF